MNTKIKQFDIDLTSVQDCNFVLDILKNTRALADLFSINYDSGDHMTCSIIVDADGEEELISKYPVFENISYYEYDLDEEYTANEKNIIMVKKSIIDDIHELKDVYARLDKLIDKYSDNDEE